MEQERALGIKSICESLLRDLEIPFQVLKTNPAFYADCRQAARIRGIPLDGDDTVGPFFDDGCDISALAYAHLSYEKQIYLALFTAIFLATDDVCKNDIHLVKDFSNRFIKGEKQGHPILDAYGLMLRELPNVFKPAIAQAMLQSGLDLFVGLVFEYEVENGPALNTPARDFPKFLRDLTGISRLYAVPIFPDSVSLRSWMEAIPGVICYIQHINDVFSFYKEELVGESYNYISVRAQSCGKSKLEALKSLVDETVQSHKETLTVLAQSPEALEAYKEFCKGYVYFHTSCKRYEVVDMWMANSQ